MIMSKPVCLSLVVAALVVVGGCATTNTTAANALRQAADRSHVAQHR
jgi:hypothetical protein